MFFINWDRFLRKRKHLSESEVKKLLVDILTGY
jgi:hypothetical protein